MAATTNSMTIGKSAFDRARVEKTQANFINAIRLSLPSTSDPDFITESGSKDLSKFIEYTEFSVYGAQLPTGVVTHADMYDIGELLGDEQPVCEQLTFATFAPVTHLVTFKNGRKYLMVLGEKEIQATTASVLGLTSMRVDQTSFTEHVDAQSPITSELNAGTSIFSFAAESNPALDLPVTLQPASCSEQSSSDFQSAETNDVDVPAEAAKGNFPANNSNLDVLPDPIVYFVDDQSVSDSIFQFGIGNASGDPQYTAQHTAQNETTTQAIVNETSTDELLAWSSTHRGSSDIFGNSSDILGTAPTPCATPLSSAESSPASNVITPGDFDNYSSYAGASPSKPRPLYATPTTSFGSSPTPKATPRSSFDNSPGIEDAVPSTPTPASRPVPTHSKKKRENKHIPQYKEIAREAYYNYKAADRPEGMIKFEHIYKYALMAYSDISKRGSVFKSGFRHAVPKEFVKVEYDKKPDSSLWWTLDHNFKGDIAASNKRNPKVVEPEEPETPQQRQASESEAPETPRKRRATESEVPETPCKKSKTNNDAAVAAMAAPVPQSSSQQLGHSLQQAQQQAQVKYHQYPQNDQQDYRPLHYQPATQDYSSGRYQPAQPQVHQSPPAHYARHQSQRPARSDSENDLLIHFLQVNKRLDQQASSLQKIQQPVDQLYPEQSMHQPVPQTSLGQSVQQPVEQASPGQQIQQPVPQFSPDEFQQFQEWQRFKKFQKYQQQLQLQAQQDV